MNLVARYGGDEFISVLSDATVGGARVYVQRVAARIETDPILAPSKIKVSTGLAAFDKETMKRAADVIQAADADLYRIKGERRK